MSNAITFFVGTVLNILLSLSVAIVFSTEMGNWLFGVIFFLLAFGSLQMQLLMACVAK